MYRKKHLNFITFNPSRSHPLLHRVGLTFCQTVTLKPTNASYPGLDTTLASNARLDSTPLPSLTGEVGAPESALCIPDGNRTRSSALKGRHPSR